MRHTPDAASAISIHGPRAVHDPQERLFRLCHHDGFDLSSAMPWVPISATGLQRERAAARG